MYGIMYESGFDIQAITGAIDLFELVAPSDAVVVVHSLQLFQTTDLGDAAEEVLRLKWTTGHATAGSGGATLTPRSMNFGGPAAGSTLLGYNTTIASTGTPIDHRFFGWNIRVPFMQIFTPEDRLILSPSRRGVLRLTAAPADSVSIGGAIVFEEIGG